MTNHYLSWGGLKSGAIATAKPRSRAAVELPLGSWLAYGNGRSYGDSCFPDRGTLVDTRGLNQLIAFDPDSGRLKAEAGMLLGDALHHIIPDGWFLPVVPGTRLVTLGGALANDIHGKNHHANGTFGEHVLSFELLRSDGTRLICSPQENSELYRATIGGMGLTGLVVWIEIQAMRVSSPNLMQEALPLRNLADFFRMAPASDASHVYSVAWIDSLAKGASLGRGVLLRANHASSPASNVTVDKQLVSVPFTPPISLINSLSLKAFNALYHHRALNHRGEKRVGWRPFFFPLDAVGHWNRLYGPRGLRQHQSVIPLEKAESTIAQMLECTHRAREGSFLTVLKLFGDRRPAGLLSFPKAGATLTLDFPYRGQSTDALLDRLDALTLAAGGRVNPYKDAHMSTATFAASFPEAAALAPYIDPMARSRFAARVGFQSRIGLATVAGSETVQP